MEVLIRIIHPVANRAKPEDEHSRVPYDLPTFPKARWNRGIYRPQEALFYFPCWELLKQQIVEAANVQSLRPVGKGRDCIFPRGSEGTSNMGSYEG
jgi:hypothetical protein